ncbi:e77a15c6-6382-4c1c-83ab-2c9886868a27 [Thermothielavioides terrestris]|jgi:protein TilB
MFN